MGAAIASIVIWIPNRINPINTNFPFNLFSGFSANLIVWIEKWIPVITPIKIFNIPNIKVVLLKWIPLMI